MRDAVTILLGAALLALCLAPFMMMAASNFDALATCEQTHSRDTCLHALR